MYARVHSIETMGLLDGPGIRTVIFLQGCPLRCLYCHNPDSQKINAGSLMSTDEIMALVKRYRNYYGAEGGVTFSGGEPLLQGEFLAEILPRLKNEGISTCIDTSGFGDPKYYKKVLPFVDTMLLDVKAFNDEDFQARTRGNYQTFLRFMKELESNRFHGQIWVRHVMVPTWTDNQESMQKLVDTINPIAHFVDRIEILPYHEMGVAKYKELGIPYQLSDKEAMDATLAKEFSNYANSLFRKRLSEIREEKRMQANRKAKSKNVFATLNRKEAEEHLGEMLALDLFSSFTDETKEIVYESMEYRLYKEGSVLFTPGDAAEQMYFILSGSMKIISFSIDGYEQILYVYGPGDFVGGHNLQFAEAYHYLGELLEDSLVAVISKELYEEYLSNNKDVLYAIMQKSFERIRWAEDLIARLSTSNANMKMAALLLQLQEAYGEKQENGEILLHLPIDREEMGSYVGLSRETVARKLGEFQDLGYIDFSDKRSLTILDLESLQNTAL